MKTKILVFVLLVVLAAFALASCDLSGDCEHTFSENWASDAENHWHAATCEHGEIKDSLAPHIDADENGICDVCENEIGHNHTFAKDWSMDDSKHWKAATCSHTDVKGEEGLHKDDNTDGVCEVCEGHVHILDGAGYCKGCDKVVNPPENNLQSIIDAISVRSENIVSGSIDYSAISSFKNGDSEIAHTVEFILGTNGTYSKRFEDEIEVVGEYPNAYVQKTGKIQILEKWIEIVSEEEVKGVFATSVDGVYENAEPSAFGIEDLEGYYYTVSTIAHGHGAEAVLTALYELALGEGITNFVVVFDEDNRNYKFSYNLLTVNETVTDIGKVYNANYYDVSVDFSYSDKYELTGLDIVCKCYTNDAGSDDDGNKIEEEIDFDYDPQNGTIDWRDNYRADTYDISVTQTAGTRQQLELDVSSKFAPTDFNIYLDGALSQIATNVQLVLNNYDSVFYLECTPLGSFMSFFGNDFDITVKDSEGNISYGLGVYLMGDVISLYPYVAGEYTIEFSTSSKTQVVNAEVLVQPSVIKGEKSFELTTTDSYIWSDYYEFTATKSGTYIFYLPINLGILEKDAYENNGEPLIDPFDGEKYVASEEHKITIYLEEGEKFCFYYAATTVGKYVVGYSEPEND